MRVSRNVGSLLGCLLILGCASAQSESTQTNSTKYFPLDPRLEDASDYLRGILVQVLPLMDEPPLMNSVVGSYVVRIASTRIFKPWDGAKILRIERSADGTYISVSEEEVLINDQELATLIEEIEKWDFFTLAEITGGAMTGDIGTPIVSVEVFDGQDYHVTWSSVPGRGTPVGDILIVAEDLANVDMLVME